MKITPDLKAAEKGTMQARTIDQQSFSTFLRRTFRSIISPFKLPQGASCSPVPSDHGSSSTTSNSPKRRKTIESYIRPGPSLQSIAGESQNEQKRLDTLKSPLTQASDPNLEAQQQAQPSLQDTDGFDRNGAKFEGVRGLHTLRFTEDMVAQLKNTIKVGSQMESLEKELRKAKFEATNADVSVTQSYHLLHRTANPEEIDEINKYIKELAPTLQEASERRDHLEGEIRIYKSNLESSQGRSIGIIERLLAEAGLLEPFEQESPTNVQPSQATTRHSATSDPVSETPFDGFSYFRNPFTGEPIATTMGSTISLEELTRRALREDLEQARSKFFQFQVDFDNREEDCRIERENYRQAVIEGTCDMPPSEFDLIQVRGIQGMTRDLIEAEVEYEALLAQARGLGLVVIDLDQESNFDDREDDGYRESQDAAHINTASSSGFVEDWLDQVQGFQDADYQKPGLERYDGWEVESVGIGDSVSCVDESRNRRRIDRWRDICEELRVILASSLA